MFILNRNTLVNSEEQGNINLGGRIRELLSHSKQFDMLVGFFYFSGIKVIHDELKNNQNLKMRVLVGLDADVFSGRLVELANSYENMSFDDARNMFYESLQRIVSSDRLDNESFSQRLDVFIKMLQERRLEVRKTLNPNHSKLYIYTMNDFVSNLRPCVWITGSSNFSEPGLSLRDELNVEICDFGTVEARDYFESLWSEAIPLTEDNEQVERLVGILRDKSVAAEVTPFEAYFVVLKNYLEYQKSQLNEERLNKILENAHYKKYKYQVDAVAIALKKLEEYNGVIIADVVGLGKSIIGSLIGAMIGKRGMVICPPGLMGDPSGAAGGWYGYLSDFDLRSKGWDVFSRGNLDGVLERLSNDPNFEIVIIDEAHNFRNESTESYQKISEICHGKKVVLLSATPFNNKPDDLLALIHLFSTGMNSPFVVGGNIDDVFKRYSDSYRAVMDLRKAIQRKDWARIHAFLNRCGITIQEVDGAISLDKVKEVAKTYGVNISREIRQVMEKIIIRRNRIDLMDDPDFREEIGDLSIVKPSKEQFFELSEEQDKFYDSVIKDFGDEGCFTGAIYQPQEYLLDSDHDDYQKSICKILRSQLVLRFESSFGAFRCSLENVLSSIKLAKEFIERMGCFLYSKRAMEKILDVDDFGEAVRLMNEEIERQQELFESNSRGVRRNAVVYSMKDRNFDGDKFLADIDSDITLITDLIKKVDELNIIDDDPKAKKLVEIIKDVLNNNNSDISIEGNAPKRKVLCFTTFSDTLNHIRKYVEAEFGERVMCIDGSNFNNTRAQEIMRNFDASFPSKEDKYDILLCTDKLSEGFNLNRAGLVINYDIPWNPTRVIQRVGRINRIGKKVFDNLYVFNFYPTVKGATIVQSRTIAEQKMFAIHTILGEDAQLFSIDETPTASALFTKSLTNLDNDEDISFYTEMKNRYKSALIHLKRKNPNALNRIEHFPNLIKTAWHNDKHAAIMFKRVGPSFFAIAHEYDTQQTHEIPLEDALELIACNYDERRVPFSEKFWDKRQRDGTLIEGVYTLLKNYKADGRTRSSVLSDLSRALTVISEYRARLNDIDLQRLNVIDEDLTCYRTLPKASIKAIADVENEEQMRDVLVRLFSVRQIDYLEMYKRRMLRDCIVVTIEKNGETN